MLAITVTRKPSGQEGASCVSGISMPAWKRPSTLRGYQGGAESRTAQYLLAALKPWALEEG